MTANLPHDLEIYHQQVYPNSPVSHAYRTLINFVQQLRTDFTRTTTEYQVGNLSLGYLDYTYFPFFNDTLRQNKLRFGIVLNHQELRFELWLMAQNANEQRRYWSKLKDLN